MSTPKTAMAGTLESNDILVTITETPSVQECAIHIESIVMNQFGAAITATIAASLKAAGMTGVRVDAHDKGALDCTIKARMEAALARYKELQP